MFIFLITGQSMTSASQFKQVPVPMKINLMTFSKYNDIQVSKSQDILHIYFDEVYITTRFTNLSDYISLPARPGKVKLPEVNPQEK